MAIDHAAADHGRFGAFIRLGGATILVTLAIHIVANFFIKEFPPEDPSLAELTAYLQREAGSWVLVHGLRYAAIPCLVLFAAAMYVRTVRIPPRAATGWGVVGLLGSTILVTNLMMTNGIETLAFLDFELLSGKPELFWLLFYMTRILFTAEIVAWATVTLGFSLAGWSTTSIPRWLSILGLVSCTAGFLSGVFIGSVLQEGAGEILMTIAGLTGMAWFGSAGVYLLMRGAALRSPARS